ncbi:pilin N-terminal domain-containing protein [Enterococcus gilvus]|uniref:pilin N-terminal domain-containing protein n=1 Tax=Enterococcus gilvus TaxID=160453 RepID=UPI00291199F1|nr:pilin N-terminal domain-containing protein [Enterococcus gilvus]MDU5509039.1 pilin N-terminal domain-containing protein [Enterococcus gilvus]
MKKKKLIFSALLCLLASMLLSVVQASEVLAAPQDEVTIVLHKRALREADMEAFDPHQNDGNKAEDAAAIYTKTTPLEGAIFDVYDVTQLYIESELGENDFLDRINDMSCQQAIAYLKKRQMEPIVKQHAAAGKTDAEGVTQFTLPSYNQQLKKDAAYVIVETGVDPTAGVTVDLSRARPFAVVLPLKDPITHGAMATIHLYPKNLSYLRNPYFYKLGKKQDTTEVALAGAVFGLYRYNDRGEKEYLHKDPTAELKNKWLVLENPSTELDIARFVSDKEGLVEMPQHYLPAGTYYFDELQGVAGYAVSKEARAIEVIIPDTSRDDAGKLQPITVNGYRMEEDDNGTITAAAKEKKEPRVYNDQRSKLPDTLDETPDGKEKLRRLLPKTGEAAAPYLMIAGAILLVGSLLIRQRRKRS